MRYATIECAFCPYCWNYLNNYLMEIPKEFWAKFHHFQQQQYWTERGWLVIGIYFCFLLSYNIQYSIIPALICANGETKWRWTDGTPLDYKPPKGMYHSGTVQFCHFYRKSNKIMCAYFQHWISSARAAAVGTLRRMDTGISVGLVFFLCAT